MISSLVGLGVICTETEGAVKVQTMLSSVYLEGISKREHGKHQSTPAAAQLSHRRKLPLPSTKQRGPFAPV